MTRAEHVASIKEHEGVFRFFACIVFAGRAALHERGAAEELAAMGQQADADAVRGLAMLQSGFMRLEGDPNEPRNCAFVFGGKR